MGLLPVAAGLGALGLGGGGALWLARGGNGGDDDTSGGQTTVQPDERPPADSTDTDTTTEDESGDGIPTAVATAVDTGDDHRDTAREHLDAREYDQALEAFTEAREAYETAQERASNHDAADTDDITAKLQTVADGRETVHRQRLSAQLNDIQGRLPSIADLESPDDFDRAKETLDSLQAELDDLHERATERGLDDLAADVETLQQQREDHLEAVEQQQAKRQRLADQVNDLQDQIPSIDDLSSPDDFDQAKETLNSLEADLTDLHKRASDRGFDSLAADVETLQQQREDRLEAVEQRLKDRAPASIPRAPDIAVDYDSLADEVPIGSGGNADVTKATLPAPGGDVTLAIKKPRMSGTLHTETVERLLAEAETWDKLDDHDHIVGVVDYDSDPLPWIAMEYMDGGPLNERAGDLELDQALWTALGVTNAVRHAHRRGVAHLDLKPGNILFRSIDGAWDAPKVADWGLSKQLLEHSKSVEGFSPTYAAPEQFDDDYGAADDITDVYQLGAVFYELFTGRPPYEGQPAAVMNKVLTEEPTPPSEVADLPPELDDILLTALATERADRYESVLYLRDDLQALFDRE